MEFSKKFDVIKKIIKASSITVQKQQQFLEIIGERLNRVRY